MQPTRTNLTAAALRFFGGNFKICLPPSFLLSGGLLALSLIPDTYDLGFVLSLFPFVAIATFIMVFTRHMPLKNDATPLRNRWKILLKRAPRIIMNAIPFLFVGFALLNVWFIVRHTGVDLEDPAVNIHAAALGVIGIAAQFIGAMLFFLAMSYLVFNLAQVYVLTSNGIALPPSPVNQGNRKRLLVHFLILVVPIYIAAALLKGLTFAASNRIDMETFAHTAPFFVALAITVWLRIIELALMAAFAYVTISAFHRERSAEPAAVPLLDKPLP